MKIDGYKDREVLMVTYEFDQSTDVEGQMAGIPRGGKIRVRVKALNDGTPRGGRLTVRVKALNDGNSQMLQWMLAPNDPAISR